MIMRNLLCSLLILYMCMQGLCARDSFLTAQQFPKTFEDLSFVQRMEILTDGYEDWESEYDSSGRCIRGCAYSGITIEEELASMQRQTEFVEQELRSQGLLPEGPKNQEAEDSSDMGSGKDNIPAFPEPSVSNQDAQAQDTPLQQSTVEEDAKNNVPDQGSETPKAPSCPIRKSDIPYGQKVPLGEPVMGKPRISSKFGKRRHPVTGKMGTHKGIDLVVSVGTNVYSPADGVILAVEADNICGKKIKITHADGYETVYCHLSQQLVKKGEKVEAGCLIGKSGNTGRSTGPHLHYGIKKNGVFINPAKLMGR